MGQNEQRTLTMLWGAFIATIGIYAGVIVFVRAVTGLDIPPVLPETAWFAAYFIAIISACGTAIASLIFKSRLIDAASSDDARWQGYIVSFACADVIGIYGLVLSFCTGAGIIQIAPFFLLSLILLALMRPRSIA